MTVTVRYTDEDFRRIATEHYASNESRGKWRGFVASTVIGSLFLTIFSVAWLPWPLATALIVGVPTILGLAVYGYYPIYVRRGTTEYLKSCPPVAYSLTVERDGLLYAKDGDAIRYSGSSIRSVHTNDSGDIILNLLDNEWIIHASAFETPEVRRAFVDAVQSLRGESAGGANWWTQEIGKPEA